MTDAPIAWPELFAAHRRYLWSVCYRMTGDALDAEDLVQATFERALQRPPEVLGRPWRPWLTRVASNLAIDLLRRRSHAAYSQLESARFAFLLALETLDPRARAVLILRDVLGYSGPETAEFLELTPGNVRVILHRARKQLEDARVEPRGVPAWFSNHHRRVGV